MPVSVPSHTELMRPAAEQLAERLQSIAFKTPETAVYTVGMRTHSGNEDIRKALYEQLVGPVRWTDTIKTILGTGIKVIVECGPGKVLTGLNRRIERNKDLTMLSVEDPASLSEALNAVKVS